MRVAALRRSLAAAPKPREACAPCATQSQRAKSTAVKRMPAASTGRAPLVENVRGSIYGEPQPVPTEFRNVDGERLEDGRYAAFREEATLSGAVKPENVFTDPVRTFAYGTDASFYRLIPKMVLKVETEREIQSLLKLARKHRTPVTFRAAGTSLSGQAVTDSILLKLSHTGKNWRRHAIGDEGKTITVEPGLIGGEVNRLLGSYAKRHEKDTTYRLGPDPASIDSCMIGVSRRPYFSASRRRRRRGVRNRVDGATRRRRRRGVRRCIETPTRRYRRLTHNTRRRHRQQQLVGHVLRRGPEHVSYPEGFAGGFWRCRRYCLGHVRRRIAPSLSIRVDFRQGVV